MYRYCTVLYCTYVPDVWSIYGRDKVYGRYQVAFWTLNEVRHIHNVLISSDTVEWRHDIVRELLGFYRQAPAAMCRAADGTLRLGPAQRVQTEGRPVVHTVTTWINLLLEPEQA